MSGDFRNKIAFLDIEGSPAFVQRPEGNGGGERAIRTLGKQLLWIRRFDAVEDPRPALKEFADRHNGSRLRERRGRKTPNRIGAERKGRDAGTEMEFERAA